MKNLALYSFARWFLLFNRNGDVRDTSVQKLSRLKPAFDKENGPLTAGITLPMDHLLVSAAKHTQATNLHVVTYISHAEVADIENVIKKNLLLKC